MKLKTTEIEGKTYAEVQDGKPVYVEDDGKETAFDAVGTRATISRLNGEAKTHREGKEEAEKALKAFEGISDPKAALDALKIVSNLDHKKLVDAGEVEKANAERDKVWQEKLDASDARASKLEKTLYDKEVGDAFRDSKFIKDKLILPPDIAKNQFGSSFKVEDGKIIPYGPDGGKVYSRERPGEVASFDEAIGFLVDQYPHRDSILKGSGHNGSGAPTNSNNGTGKTSMTRAQFDALNPIEQHKAATTAGFELTD